MHIRTSVSALAACTLLAATLTLIIRHSVPGTHVLASTAEVKAASGSDDSHLPVIQPAELANLLKAGKRPELLILQVGFRVLYQQAHIPGSEYVGAGSDAEGLRLLRARVANLPRTKPIVLYCGCCPWTHCPNVQPAYRALHEMGFKDVKVLFITHDFGTDWINQGYPVASGEK